ncbi:alcohol dehydrogenase [Kordiimonas sediminis]|uniref:Alcohol dehydrogenase 2 n=1 Tax=Kordiimonas sediminis TaxID=1735581 RepID=A0A919AUG7_9PROT|nr:iron-containing alcohol dehydrogenase [Kordiimonas sediminis]GHF26715.1 alcohol dehydrogenase [Kordiimonas sediminis]
MTGFSFQSVPKVLCEDGASGSIATYVQMITAGKSVLLVTDKMLRSLGILNPALNSLDQAGYKVAIFDDVVADPPDTTVLAAVDVAKTIKADCIIGFGGGSSMDVAKLVAVLTNSNQHLGDIYGIGNIQGGRLPLMQVPTTSGTGSEVTPISIVTTGETTKMGVSDPALYCDLALLDATLTLGLPRAATAATAIDAMVHAIEAYTSKHKKNPLSDALAVKALRMIGCALLDVCEDGSNLKGRRDLLIGAMLAGSAFANAPVAAVHALAYPIGGHFHVAHGLSNSLVLTHVLSFNMPSAEIYYAELAHEVGLEASTQAGRADAFATWLADLSAATGIEQRLRDVGIKAQDIEMLATDAMNQERLLINNPREVTLEDARRIYEAAW